MDRVLQNIALPKDDMEWKEVSTAWDQKMRGKAIYGENPHLQGTLDGIVVQTTHTHEVNGNVACNWNRKGYFAIVGLAAVDCRARFRYVECKWAGSTHDSTAYRSSTLAHVLEKNIIFIFLVMKLSQLVTLRLLPHFQEEG